MAKLALILGGARSGKSRFAQGLAKAIGGDDVLFVATAEARDSEMKLRIELHQRDRPAAWRLLEVPRRVGQTLARSGDRQPVVLIDCLTLLVSNILLDSGAGAAEEQVRAEVKCLLDAAARRSGTVVIVSGEAGQGVVPPTELGRQFRDLLGWANQDIAARADAVYLMVSGLAVELKSRAVSVEHAALSLTRQQPAQAERIGCGLPDPERELEELTARRP